ncbi:MAG: hypothetical protein V4735_04195 [Pseudomonadota bacterium]
MAGDYDNAGRELAPRAETPAWLKRLFGLPGATESKPAVTATPAPVAEVEVAAKLPLTEETAKAVLAREPSWDGPAAIMTATPSAPAAPAVATPVVAIPKTIAPPAEKESATRALSGDTQRNYLDLSLGSQHLCKKQDAGCGYYPEGSSVKHPFNQVNPGIGVTHMRKQWENSTGTSVWAGGSVGIYQNSVNKPSVYALANLEINQQVTKQVSVSAGVQAGLVSGYAKNILPAGELYTRIEYAPQDGSEPVSLKLGLIPKVTMGNFSPPNTLTAQFSRRF